MRFFRNPKIFWENKFRFLGNDFLEAYFDSFLAFRSLFGQVVGKLVVDHLLLIIIRENGQKVDIASRHSGTNFGKS